MRNCELKNAGFIAAAQVVVDRCTNSGFKITKKIANWENFLGYREKLWPIVASDSGSTEFISLVEGDVVGASFDLLRSFPRSAWPCAKTT